MNNMNNIKWIILVMIISIIIIITIWKIINRLQIDININSPDTQFDNNGSVIIKISGGTYPFEILFGNKKTIIKNNLYKISNLSCGKYNFSICDSNNNEFSKEINIFPININKNPYFWQSYCILNEKKNKYIVSHYCYTVKNNDYIKTNHKYCEISKLKKPIKKCGTAPYQIIKSLKILDVKHRTICKIGAIDTNNNRIHWLTLDNDVFKLEDINRKLLYFDTIKTTGSKFALRRIKNDDYTITNYDNGMSVFDGYIHNNKAFMNYDADEEIQPMNVVSLIKNRDYYHMMINGMYINRNNNMVILDKEPKTLYIFKFDP